MQCHYIMPVIFLQEISRRQSINLRLAHDARILINSPLFLLDLFLSFFLCSLSMERKMLGMIPICDESSAPSPPHARTRTARLYFLGSDHFDGYGPLVKRRLQWFRCIVEVSSPRKNTNRPTLLLHKLFFCQARLILSSADPQDTRVAKCHQYVGSVW